MGRRREGAGIMTIEEKNGNEKLTLYVSGRIDASTAPELERFVLERIEGLTELTLDFKDVVYISSAGLRVLLGTYKTMGSQKGKLVLCNVNEEVKDTLYITGFLEFLEVWNENGKRAVKGKVNTHGGQEKDR